VKFEFGNFKFAVLTGNANVHKLDNLESVSVIKL